MTDEQLNSIEARANAATIGPWEHIGEYKQGSKADYTVISSGPPIYSSAYLGIAKNEVLGTSEWIRIADEDLEFIAHSREDVPALIAEIRRLREIISHQ